MANRFSIETVFKAVDRLTAPVSRMQNRVGKFTRAMESGLRRANDMVNKLSGSIVRGAKRTAVFGIGLITTAVGFMVREFSKVEDAQAAFTPILGSAERAIELVDKLNQTAATTPFRFGVLANAAKQLLPVMSGDILRTVETIRMLGDTAGGNAQKLDSIVRGYTKAMLKGKTDMESLNMIAEAGVPIFQDLAEVMGFEGPRAGQRLFKAVSAGRVSTEKLTEAFQKATSEGGIFFRGMEIASRTTTGMFSTLLDNIALTAAALGEVLAPTVKELITAATDAARAARAWVENNQELVRGRFLEFVVEAKTVIFQLYDITKKFINFVHSNGVTIAKVAAGVLVLSVVLNTLVGVLTLVNLVMAANPLTLWIIGITALVGALSLLVMWLDNVIEKMGGFSGLAERVGGFFGDLFSDFGQTAAAATSGATGGFIDSPATRGARTINETREKSEVTIRDETGRAEVTGGKLGTGVSLTASGAF